MTLKAEGIFVRKNYSRRVLKVLQGYIKKGGNHHFPPFHRMFRLYSYYIKSPARCSSVLRVHFRKVGRGQPSAGNYQKRGYVFHKFRSLHLWT